MVCVYVIYVCERRRVDEAERWMMDGEKIE